jgi:hypothetical protein
MDDDRCVGVTTKVCIGSENVAMAEAVRLREALLMVDSMQIRKVIVELDAETIVKVVHRGIFPRTQHYKKTALERQPKTDAKYQKTDATNI